MITVTATTICDLFEAFLAFVTNRNRSAGSDRALVDQLFIRLIEDQMVANINCTRERLIPVSDAIHHMRIALESTHTRLERGTVPGCCCILRANFISLIEEFGQTLEPKHLAEIVSP